MLVAHIPLDEYERLLDAEAALKRVREALEWDLWSDRDPYGRLQQYLDALQGNPS
jgi:hypothetical protein